MANQQLKIGIILGSTRQGREPAGWPMGQANCGRPWRCCVRSGGYYGVQTAFLWRRNRTRAWTCCVEGKIESLDGFVFIVQEYNHSITGALKNALDSARDPWFNKAAGIVSYGSTGGARAAEHLRGILGELLVADVRTHPTLSLFTDFENFSVFKPSSLHLTNINGMLDQVVAWSGALKTLR